ncbi:hypothetical protein DL1_00130 [Thioclava dalianensis]|uniref:Uncharacterized protein n=1 Tax=Thioclava dalianensis TaxID=1185766 RepID=A0A074TR77_9RHOB|nr:DUF4169 family protein [Thioclava dalianensis]KEP71473.1 hypothetical protein DL1_00130 [Thioclava dalianensis]
MSKVSNLNQFRKQQARAKKRAQGAENAAKFGRTAAQKKSDDAQRALRDRQLDGHRREDET